MYRLHEGPRFEYREQEKQRAQSSPSIADKFPELESVVVDLGYFNATGTSRYSQIKFQPNITNARSVFRVDCPNNGCVGGDFDLSKELAQAVAEHRTTVTGEVCCQGWQNKTTIDSVRCHNILRYTIHLEYQTLTR